MSLNMPHSVYIQATRHIILSGVVTLSELWSGLITYKSKENTVFHAKRVECALFHLLVNISGILHVRPTYDISSRSPIFGDHFDTNGKVSHDSHVTQLANEVTMF